MLKLQPDTKPIKLKLQVNHYLIELLRLLYLSLVLKLAALDATFNFGTVLIFFVKKYRLRIKYYNWLILLPVPVNTKLPL
jgi:hypothetical protein